MLTSSSQPELVSIGVVAKTSTSQNSPSPVRRASSDVSEGYIQAHRRNPRRNRLLGRRPYIAPWRGVPKVPKVKNLRLLDFRPQGICISPTVAELHASHLAIRAD